MIDPLVAPLDVSLPTLIAESLDRGDPTTVSFDHVPYRVSELFGDASALASGLASVLQPGDRLLVMARNGRPALLAWWAARIAGAVLVPINVANRSTILEHQVRDSDPVVLLVEDEFTEVLSEAVEAVGLRPRLVVRAGALAWAGEGDVADLEDLVDAGSREARPAGHHDGPSHLIYTAGTTGPSKACMVGDHYIYNMANQMVHNLDKQAGETLWTAMPMFHLAAVTHLVGALLVGGSISLSRQFSVSRFWQDVSRSGASTVALMGSMIPMLAGAPDSEYSERCRGQLQTVSGSPVTPDIARTWRERFGVPRVGSGAYGMTEAALITSSSAEDYRVGAAGHINDSFEVQIVDEHERPLPTGSVGEIVCRPRKPGIMFQGYWNDPAKTLSVFENLWFHTGDYGRLDDDGYLFFVDRGKDYMRRGGENISSFELEQIISRHPDIAEVAVHAVPSELSEDDVKITAVLVPAGEVSAAELFDWCQDKIPRYAWPTYIEFRASLPKNPVGRVLKFLLREEGATPDTWVRPARTSPSKGTSSE